MVHVTILFKMLFVQLNSQGNQNSDSNFIYIIVTHSFFTLVY